MKVDSVEGNIGATSGRKIVVVNQAVNYLTIGFCNAFRERFEEVAVITGSVHVQGEELDPRVRWTRIAHWVERPAWRKLVSWMWACVQIWVLLVTRYRRYEVVFVSIPPMAYLLSVVVPNRCSMVIWDVYPDLFKITGMGEAHPVYRVWGWLNRVAFRRAYRVFTIGERMRGLVEQYVDASGDGDVKQYVDAGGDMDGDMDVNGGKRAGGVGGVGGGTGGVLVTPIWSIFQEHERVPKAENPFVREHGLEGKFVVQYSGNIGLTHQVEVMIDLAERMRDREDILFQIIGRGPRKPVLERLVTDRNLPNCMFLPFQSDEMFPFSLSAADVGVVIVDREIAMGSVPSKSYNLMNFGIPSLYFASEESELYHYAKRFGHAGCFDHADLDGAAAFIERLAGNSEAQEHLAERAMEASEWFRRGNADRLVDAYIQGRVCDGIA